MKRICGLFLLVGSVCYGQTNSFPSTGNAKIFAVGASWGEGLCVVRSSDWAGLRIARNDPAGGNFNGNWAIGYNGTTGNDFSISTNYNGTQYDGLFHISNSTRNVGIGTTNPIYGRFQVTQASDASDQGIAILNSTGTRAMRIWTDANNSYVYSAGTGTGTLILNNGGNVGVGTTSPGAMLHINAASRTQALRVYMNGNTTNYLNIGQGSGGAVIDPIGTGLLYLGYDQSTTVSMCYGGGAVGIGTTNPGSYKLAVEGKIGAREVNVTATNPWPDFVFEKNYKLPSLEEIKNYIDQNQHLPEVPSAKEVEKNGVSLGEMNAVLLKKIEELTLHIIKQEERIKTLEAKQK